MGMRATVFSAFISRVTAGKGGSPWISRSLRGADGVTLARRRVAAPVGVRAREGKNLGLGLVGGCDARLYRYEPAGPAWTGVRIGQGPSQLGLVARSGSLKGHQPVDSPMD